MKTIITNLKRCLALGLIAATAVTGATAQVDTSEKTYTKFKTTPEKLVIAGPAIFPVQGNALKSLTGRDIKQLGQYIIDAKSNPFCSNFFLVANDKKHNKAIIFMNNADADEIFEVNRKKLGNPWQVAYSADALKIYLATDSGLITLNAPDRLVLDRMDVTLKNPEILALSDNGYYAALAQGSELAVYNLEQKTLRKEWDFEVKINDMAFNDNSTELAVVTADGVLSIFDTRNFLIKKSIDDLGEALSCSYNSDGKYIVVAETPEKIEVINLLDTDDRETINVETAGVNVARFIPDSEGRPMLAYTLTNGAAIRPMPHLKPYYARLISDEANERLNEWLKMMPGETMEEYRARVNDESRQHQLHLFEEEISTRLAPDMLSMASVSLGKYDRANGMLQVDFSNMPSIFLPVPENDLAAFTSGDGLEFRKSTYGVLPDDSFELIYAEVFNKENGKTYVYNNIDRVPLNFMEDADNVVSLELILQQQMEEQRLEQLREQVFEQAKSQNVISDHTNMSVDSRIEPDYDADGNKILNYHVKFSYEVDPGFTATEDFAPGKYHAEASGAASSMLKLVSEALEGDFAQYVRDGKKLAVTISGTADATPIVSRILYDGTFGDIVEVPIHQNGKLVPMTIMDKEQLTRNEQLAFLRAYSVKEFLNKNIEALKNMNQTYRYDINVAEGKGSEFRRISLEFNFIDAF